MAKTQTHVGTQNLVEAAAINQAAPKKTRKRGVKYTNIVESNFDSGVHIANGNPLDAPVETVRGGLRFGGVVFETTLLGTIVKIPAKATIIKSPTLRQLMKVIDDLYTEKTA